MFSALEETPNLPALGPAFLDCGAYSVMTGLWPELPLHDYYQYVAEYHQYYATIAAPDVIGSMPDTFDNLVEFHSAMVEKGVWEDIRDRVALTYHVTDKDYATATKALKFADQAGVGWLSIGGIVAPGMNTLQRYIAIGEILNLVQRLGLKFKVHLFGGYEGEYIKAYKPDSVDSATYLQSAKVLTMTHYRAWDLVKQAVPKEHYLQNRMLMNQARLLELGDRDERQDLFNVLDEIPDGVRLWLLNAWAVKKFEDWVRNQYGQKPDFKYWITIDVTMVMAITRYSEIVQRLFWRAWGDRCLVAYPTFWAGHGQRPKHTDKLVMFT
ncbi:MAG: hypothetical protein V3T23_10910 [Nitrososphaerales archaeon]